MSASGDNEDDVTTAMGFSSFGQTRPNKKRRYNPQADQAVVDSAAGSISHPEPSGSGANALPLPLHARASAQPPGNPDEMSLEDGDGPAASTSGSTGGASMGGTSLPLPPASGLPARPAFTNIGSTIRGASFVGVPDQVHGGGRGGRAGGGGGSSRGRGDSGSFSGRDHGSRNPEWYIGYYDPASNENPWAKLEERMGLEPQGDWTLSGPVAGNAAVAEAEKASDGEGEDDDAEG
ncbi:hypothetical protein MKZ38_003055 [Zalerion maritima]|uniref:Uncharacterized protein n=1 Tax=Zalerion maritima TaxID=339359 RepID=A0AAD5RP76_9PEZI|nr:hypothetical protein MKZ38_003055 [Zalerion maritima]